MIPILLVAAGTVLETAFIMQSYRQRSGMSVLLKTLASCCFVLLGGYCAHLREGSAFADFIQL